ncbi:MAG: hypothetical protein LBK99_03835 [Opitutaceae bacterium]|nr:hypothetical protein [Opitutaceae bacterium]
MPRQHNSLATITTASASAAALLLLPLLAAGCGKKADSAAAAAASAPPPPRSKSESSPLKARPSRSRANCPDASKRTASPRCAPASTASSRNACLSKAPT